MMWEYLWFRRNYDFFNNEKMYKGYREICIGFLEEFVIDLFRFFFDLIVSYCFKS